MTEHQFIERYHGRWKAFEAELRSGLRTHPDRLCEEYIMLMDDLSYARTHFRGSSLTAYLNQLAVAAHRQIYGTKRESSGRFLTFFRDEVPAVFYASRRFFGYAAIIFLGAACLGWLSGTLDPDFLRMILGDSYVNQTLYHIEEGDPMGVYGSSPGEAMFFMISINNIRVSFIAFILGIFGGIPTALLLLYNGIMVGAFLQFFMQHQLLGETVTTILLHGAIELTAIVVAGGCGLMLGNAVLFPGTYSRGVSLVTHARRALKIILGVMPFILIAAWIESYVTRHYQALHYGIRLVLIFGTFAFMILYLFSGRKKQKNGYTV